METKTSIGESGDTASPIRHQEREAGVSSSCWSEWGPGCPAPGALKAGHHSSGASQVTVVTQPLGVAKPGAACSPGPP